MIKYCRPRDKDRRQASAVVFRTNFNPFDLVWDYSVRRNRVNRRKDQRRKQPMYAGRRPEMIICDDIIDKPTYKWWTSAEERREKYLARQWKKDLDIWDRMDKLAYFHNPHWFTYNTKSNPVKWSADQFNPSVWMGVDPATNDDACVAMEWAFERRREQRRGNYRYPACGRRSLTSAIRRVQDIRQNKQRRLVKDRRSQ